MEELKEKRALYIEQKAKWSEALTGLETKNEYIVKETSDAETGLYYANEAESSVLTRNLLGPIRPFSVDVISPTGRRALRLRKPFKFFLHEMDVFDSCGARLGSIKKKSIFSYTLSVFDASGLLICELNGGLFFKIFVPTDIMKDGAKIGEVKYYYGDGLGEATKDIVGADNISVTFPADLEVNHKALLLAAAILIDFIRCEYATIHRRGERLFKAISFLSKR